MNWMRGFLRLWAIVSCFWIAYKIYYWVPLFADFHPLYARSYLKTLLDSLVLPVLLLVPFALVWILRGFSLGHSAKEDIASVVDMILSRIIAFLGNKKGLFRIWIVFAVCWIAGQGYFLRNDLVAMTEIGSGFHTEESLAAAEAERDRVKRGEPPKPPAPLIPDWTRRGEALQQILLPPALLPPLVLLLLILIKFLRLTVAWIARGFRTAPIA